jgi:hypothetical protein
LLSCFDHFLDAAIAGIMVVWVLVVPGAMITEWGEKFVQSLWIECPLTFL